MGFIGCLRIARIVKSDLRGECTSGVIGFNQLSRAPVRSVKIIGIQVRVGEAAHILMPDSHRIAHIVKSDLSKRLINSTYFAGGEKASLFTN